jgi:xanthine dehydrogenase accessory factor
MDWFSGLTGVLVTVVEAQGSTPRKLGARMLVRTDGSLRGTIGGGAVEETVRAACTGVWERGAAELLDLHLTHDLGMCCGGRMRFLLEPLGKKPSLILFGCGHVGGAIARAASPLDLRIWGVDDLSDHRTEPAVGTWRDDFAADDLPWGPETLIVIATHSHAADQAILERLVGRDFRFLGVIGSQRKAKMQRERLRAKGVDDAWIDRIHCPMGLPIGSETPEEIAISVCAQLIQVLRS